MKEDINKYKNFDLIEYGKKIVLNKMIAVFAILLSLLEHF